MDLNVMFENEIELRMGDIVKDRDNHKSRLDKITEVNRELKHELYNFKKENELDKMLLGIKEFITIENIRTIFSLVGLKSNPITLEEGMYFEKIPTWFKLYWRHYPDKEKVLLYFDLFNIDYDKNILNFKMPWELEKKYVVEWIKNCDSNGFVNICYVKGNGGFFYKALKGHKFKTEDMVNKKEGFINKYLPWQYMMMNEFILDDKIFESICNKIEKSNKANYSSNYYYFYDLYKHQELNDVQLHKLAILLPNKKNRIYDIHKNFMKNNRNILKSCPWLENNFMSEINTSEYSPFFYGNYSDQIQFDYLNNMTYNIDSFKSYVKKSTLSKDDKLALMDSRIRKVMDDILEDE